MVSGSQQRHAQEVPVTHIIIIIIIIIVTSHFEQT